MSSFDAGTNYSPFIHNLGYIPSGVAEYVIDGSLSEQDALNLTFKQITCLKNLDTGRYIDLGLLSLQDSICLTKPQEGILISRVVQGYIQERLLQSSQLKLLSKAQCLAMLNTGVQKYVSNGKLSLKNAIDLIAEDDNRASSILGIREFQTAIDNEEMTIEEAVQFSYEEIVVFVAEKRADISAIGANKYVELGLLSERQFKTLTNLQKACFNTPAVQLFIDGKLLSVEKVLNLTHYERLKMDSTDNDYWLFLIHCPDSHGSTAEEVAGIGYAGSDEGLKEYVHYPRFLC
jgi:hypothetical protein